LPPGDERKEGRSPAGERQIFVLLTKERQGRKRGGLFSYRRGLNSYFYLFRRKKGGKDYLFSS